MRLPVIYICMLGLALGLISGCRRQASFILDCHLDNHQGRALVISEIDPEKGFVFIDSIFPNREGEYNYRLADNNPHQRMFAIFPANHPDQNLILIPQHGEKIVFQSDYMHIARHLQVNRKEGINGYTAALDLLDFQKKFSICQQQADSLSRVWSQQYRFSTNHDSLYQHLARQSQSIAAEIRKEARSLMEKHPGSLISIFMTNKTWNNETILDPMDPKERDYLKKSCRDLQKNDPGNPHAERLLFNLERMESMERAEKLRKMEEAARLQNPKS